MYNEVNDYVIYEMRLFMRILHTADWHLGRIFYGEHLTKDQANIINNQFFPLLKEECIDVVIIAGDIFDRSVPPIDAVELWDEIITKLAMEYKIPMIAIAGNHDGASRLSFGSSILEKQNIHIIGSTNPNSKPIIINDKYGEIYFCPMPFADPIYFSQIYAQGKQQTFDSGFNLVKNNLLKNIPQNSRKIAIAHAFVTGGAASTSERPLTLGGSEQINGAIFNEFNYTALGHLHQAQEFKNKSRYSGSLMKYSFDEHKQKKSFTIVDIDNKGCVEIGTIPITMPRDVRVLKGSFKDIIEGEIYKKNLEESKSLDDYILAQLTDKVPVIDALARLRKVYPNIMAIDPIGRMEVSVSNDVKVYKNLNERELFSQFAEQIWDKKLDENQTDYMNKLWDEIAKEEK